MPSSLKFAPQSSPSSQRSWRSPNAVFHRKTGSTGRQSTQDALGKHLAVIAGSQFSSGLAIGWRAQGCSIFSIKFDGLALCSPSRQWRSSWEDRSGHEGAVGVAVLVHQPFPPWCPRGRCRCTWTADALAGCEWCSSVISQLFPLPPGERQQTTRRRSGTSSGTATFFLLNHTLLGTEPGFSQAHSHPFKYLFVYLAVLGLSRSRRIFSGHMRF